MIIIIVEFTEQEKKQIAEIEKKYEQLFEVLDAIINSRNDEPDESIIDEANDAVEKLRNALPDKPSKSDIEKYNAEAKKIFAISDQKFKEWENAGGSEWLKAREQKDKAITDFNKERSELYYKAEQRQFLSLNGDLQNILEDAKSQARQLIYNSHQFLLGDDPGDGSRAYNEDYIINSTKLLNATYTRNMIYKSLEMHINALRSDETLYNTFSEFVNTIIKHSEYVDRKSIQEMTSSISTFSKKSLIEVSTKYPNQYITPTDKISRSVLIGEIEGAKMNEFAMEKRGSKKEITNLVSIDYEELNGSVQIKGRKELTPYDREVHDAIVTLFVDGENEYITPQMIYQTMTGNPKNRLETKQAQAISDSITKCMYSRITINAEQEAKAYGFETLKYDGNLIHAERVTATLNGEVLECLHILRMPILYEYADRKNQIGRFDIKYLNSPINKTEEILTMQGYLHRRILSMKGSNLSKTIVYETVYKYIDIEAATPGALRKKKAKIRSQIKIILDYWKQEKFISGYVENKRGAEIYSVTIRL